MSKNGSVTPARRSRTGSPRTVGRSGPDGGSPDLGQIAVTEDVEPHPTREIQRTDPARGRRPPLSRPRAAPPGPARRASAPRDGQDADPERSRPSSAAGGGALPAADDRQRDRLAGPVSVVSAPPPGLVGEGHVAERDERLAAQDAGEVLAGGRLLDRGDLLGRALGDDPAAAEPAGRPGSTIQSAVLITSRLCSMTRTVLPWSTSRWRTWRSFSTSAKCRPVVGSSRT